TVVQVRCDEATGRQIAMRMRACDRAWRRRGTLAVMLVETDGTGARSAVQRIAQHVPLADIRLATFPDDTLTVEGLLDPAPTATEVADGIAEAASRRPRPTAASSNGGSTSRCASSPSRWWVPCSS